MKHNRLSIWVIAVMILVCAWTARNLDIWGRNKIIQNDVTSYYAYLPAALLFSDLNFEFTKDLPDNFEGSIWLVYTPDGKPLLRMTMGLAMLWSPFFLMAHATAHIMGVSTLGYSWPYSFFIFVANIFYLFIGLFFLRKVLLRYFSDVAVAATLVIIVLATNLMYYVISEPGMTHVYSFSLIVVFIFYALKWIERPGLKHTIILGLLAGIIVLIRPVNGLVLLFPALGGISSYKDFSNRLVNNWRMILLAGVVAFLMLIPQMLYWKAQTGHYIFNSYMDQGRFYFLQPQILNGLFSYRKGWLVYTPGMILAFSGLFFTRRMATPIFFPILIFTVVNIYVVYSWWTWWYGGSFGSRPMIDMYGIMAVPLAAFIDHARKGKNWMKFIVVTIFVAFLLLNQFQMAQYRTSVLHWDSMTKEAYWGIFAKKRFPDGYEDMIMMPDYDKALKGEREYP